MSARTTAGDETTGPGDPAPAAPARPDGGADPAVGPGAAGATGAAGAAEPAAEAQPPAATGEPGGTRPVAGRARRPRPRLAAAVHLLALLLAVSALHVTHAVADTEISVFDEVAHYSQAVEIKNGRLPNYGTIMSDEALQGVGCRPWQATQGGDFCFGETVTGRAIMPPASSLPAQGAVYTAGHPPPYYVVTAGALLLAEALDRPAELVAARLGNLVWLWVGVVATWFAARSLSGSRLAASAAAALAWASPAMVSMGAMVNSDIAVVTVAALALAAIARYERTGRGAWLVGLAAAAGPAVKQTGFVLPVAVALYLAVRALQGVLAQRRSAGGQGRYWSATRGPATAFTWALALSLLAVVPWTRLQEAIRTAPPGFTFTTDRQVESLPFGSLLRLDSVFLLDFAAVGFRGLSDVGQLLTQILVITLLALAAAAPALARTRGPAAALAITGLLGVYLASVVFALSHFVLQSSHVSVIPRYLIALVVFQAAAAAVALGRLGRLASAGVLLFMTGTAGSFLMLLVLRGGSA